MPQPTSYTPTTDFSADELANTGGRSTVRTAELDAEHSAIAATLAGVLTNLALNQRDDGEIRDERVKLHTLSSDVRALMGVASATIRGAWLTATAYAMRDVITQGGSTYICAVAHTSGTFATDWAAVKWVLISLGASTSASGVPFTPTATLAATNVQAALEEADTEGRAQSAVAAAAASATVVADLADAADPNKGDFGLAVKLAATGAVARTQHDKNADTVHAADFGAVGSGDETIKLKACFDFAIPLARKVVLRGAYTVSGTISSNSVLAVGSLHIHCDGDVTITVDAASTAFSRLISCETTAANSVTITGGRLTIVGNSKVGSAIYARHYGQGGMVNIENVKVSGCKNVNFAVENGGIYLYGRWAAGRLGVIEVDGVDRSGAGTASRGVLIADASGPFTIEALKVSNVLSTGFAADADGLYFSGYTSGGANSQREGSLTVQRAEFIDCQGRSIKAQHQDVVLRDVIVRRQLVTTFAVPDIDFQLGGGQIDTLLLQYIKNAGVSPLNASFYPLASQHTCTDRTTVCRIGKVTLRAEMQVPRLAQIIVGATALDASTYIDGVDLVPYSAFTGGFFSRCAVEFDAGQVAASSNKTFISAARIRGDMTGVPVLGHVSFAASVVTKLSVEAIANENTGTASASTKTIAAVSGADIPAFLQFNFRENIGFHALMMSTLAFDAQKLADGCRFTYVRATSTVTNGPAIAAGTYVDVECLGSINGTSKKVRMTVDNAGTMDEWYTQSGAWGVIK